LGKAAGKGARREQQSQQYFFQDVFFHSTLFNSGKEI
jgi:hypothetical protein